MRDDINRLERDWIGEKCRLEIPLQSVANLKRVAEELRGLASQFESLYHYPLDTPTATMLEVKTLCRRANKKLETIRGRGRPKKGRQFQSGPKIW